MVSGLMVPRPITYVPSLSLLLTEQAEGRLMRELFEERDDKAEVPD